MNWTFIPYPVSQGEMFQTALGMPSHPQPINRGRALEPVSGLTLKRTALEVERVADATASRSA